MQVKIKFRSRSLVSKYNLDVCSFFDQLKGGCGSLTPLSFINYLNQGCDSGNCLYQKLWTHLDNREKCGLRSTKFSFVFTNVSLRVVLGTVFSDFFN